MPAPNTAQRALAAALVLACPLVAVVFVLKPKHAETEPSPVRLTAATRFGAAPRWSEPPLGGNIPYQWYSQNAYLYRRADRSLASSENASGKSDPLAGIRSSYHAVGGDLEDGGPSGPIDWVLSPDRRWLLTALGYSNRRRWAAMTLDGTRRVTFPARFNFHPFVCWKGDSSGWIELFRGRTSPSIAAYSVVPGATPAPVTPLPRLREGFYGQPEMLGGIGSDAFVVATLAEDERRRMPLHIFHTGRVKDQPARLGVPLPQQSHMMEVEMSPDGRRLAWVLFFPDRQRHGFALPFFRSNAPKTVQQLWISDLGGARMRRIAASATRGGEELTAIHFVRWLPDGKSVSFVDGASLYTIPAN